jgi:ABC-type sulfate/molybdate transport systems ATPase subunit
MATLQADFALPLRAFALELALDVSRTVALVGPSGAGKSSALRVVAGLAEPARGRVLLDDEPWLDTDRGISLPPERRRVGLVFQDYALFPHLSVRANVAFGAGGRGVDALLERFRIAQLATAHPGKLSGGERQRVAIARALVGEPAIVLADEPTGNLDSATGDELLALLGKLNRQGTTLLIITHNDAVAAAAGRKIVLRDGRVVADSGG